MVGSRCCHFPMRKQDVLHVVILPSRDGVFSFLLFSWSILTNIEKGITEICLSHLRPPFFLPWFFKLDVYYSLTQIRKFPNGSSALHAVRSNRHPSAHALIH